MPLRGIRRTIAQGLWQSHLYTVRTLNVDEADLTELVRLRERLKPQAEAQGVKLTYLPFIVKAVVRALKKFPMLNYLVHKRSPYVHHELTLFLALLTFREPKGYFLGKTQPICYLVRARQLN